MSRFLFFVTTFVIGFYLQLFSDRFMSFLGVSPEILLLFVIAFGFFCGPVMGEVFGFFWGLTLDVMGVTLFGLNSFLLALAGYGAGKLRQRVASERPTAQIAIGLAAAFAYEMSALMLHRLFLVGVEREFLKGLLVGSFFNVLLVRFVFYLSDRWLSLWKVHQKEIES